MPWSPLPWELTRKDVNPTVLLPFAHRSGGWAEGQLGLMFDERGLAAPLIDQSEDANGPAFPQGVG